MIDTTTILRTRAFSPAWCKLRAAVVKKSVAACCSGDGPVAVSTMHSTPFSASARPSPLITSTPVDRDIATTSCRRAWSTSTTCRPTLPVAPATAIFTAATPRPGAANRTAASEWCLGRSATCTSRRCSFLEWAEITHTHEEDGDEDAGEGDRRSYPERVGRRNGDRRQRGDVRPNHRVPATARYPTSRTTMNCTAQ